MNERGLLVAIALGLLAVAPACLRSTPGVGDAAIGADGATADDPAGVADADAGPTAPPDAGTALDGSRAIYVAQAGVATPLWTPVGPAGAGATIPLAPERASGYGEGQGTVAYPDLTPDGSRFVVVFQPLLGGSVLYALPVTGEGVAGPVELGRADALSATQRAYSTTHVAWVDDGDLYAAPLDGSGKDAPTLVASSPEGRRVEHPKWAGDRLVYDSASTGSGSWSEVRSALADGSEASGPVSLSGGPQEQEHAAAVLPDDRVVVYGTDDRLHVIAADGTGRVAVTPLDWLASYQGVAAGGSRVVAELRVTWDDERHLISAATDGSDAATPTYLTAQPVEKLDTVVSRDGARAAWRARDAATGKWAIYDAATDAAPPSLEAARVSAWSSDELHVTDYDASANALVGSSTDGRVLRFPLDAGPDAAPVVLVDVGPIVNYSQPWPRVSVDGAQVLYDANTESGWLSGVVPLGGGVATTLPGAWYRDLVTPHGILHDVHTTLAGVFAAPVEGTGTPTPLSGWHRAPISDARLVEDGAWAVYACDAPTPGWYAVPTDQAAEGGETAETPVLPPLTESTLWTDWWSATPMALDGHLLGRVDGALRAWPLDGSGPEDGVVVISDITGQAAAHRASGRVVAVKGAAVVSAPADGSASPVTVLEAPGQVSALAVVPDGDRALVVASGDGGEVLLAAALDGSEAAAPFEAAAGLAGWTMMIGPVPGGAYALTVHSILATAVPHPDLVLTSSLLPGTGPSGAELAPAGYVPWAVPLYLETLVPTELVGAFATPDGAHVMLIGPDGLYSARPDASDAAAPVHLGDATKIVGPPIGPDGRSLLVVGADGGQLHVSQAGEAASQKPLTQVLDGTITAARWTPAGDAVVFRVSTEPFWEDVGVLYRVDAQADAPTPTGLVADDAPVGALLSLTPDGAAVVVESRAGGDESLYVVPLEGGPVAEPTPLSPVDDAAEVLIGFAP